MTPTTESDPPGQILKSDKLGRVRVAAERREAILDEFERSGMSGAAFAAHYGINYQTFAAWRQKRRRRGEGATGTSAAAGPEKKWGTGKRGQGKSAEIAKKQAGMQGYGSG